MTRSIKLPRELVEQARSLVAWRKAHMEVSKGEKDVINYMSLVCINLIVLFLSVAIGS